MRFYITVNSTPLLILHHRKIVSVDDFIIGTLANNLCNPIRVAASYHLDLR